MKANNKGKSYSPVELTELERIASIPKGEERTGAIKQFAKDYGRTYDGVWVAVHTRSKMKAVNGHIPDTPNPSQQPTSIVVNTNNGTLQVKGARSVRMESDTLFIDF